MSDLVWFTATVTLVAAELLRQHRHQPHELGNLESRIADIAAYAAEARRQPQFRSTLA